MEPTKLQKQATMPTLVLLRHGTTVLSEESRFAGWADTPLSAAGMAEARAAGRVLAAAVRESSGGLPGVQALGLELAGGIQLSTNVIDLDATPPHVLVERVLDEATARGLDVGAGELVGLIPAGSVAEAAAAAGVVEPVDRRGLPTPAALAAAARALRLEKLEPDRVLEWHLQ